MTALHLAQTLLTCFTPVSLVALNGYTIIYSSATFGRKAAN